jgi:hypothetical protein
MFNANWIYNHPRSYWNGGAICYSNSLSAF